MNEVVRQEDHGQVPGRTTFTAPGLDIGGGPSHGRDPTTIDLRPRADLVHDLDVYPWPIKSDTFTWMKMFHVLEHLKDPLAAMKECYRIARNGCILNIRVPWWRTDLYTNPYHYHRFQPAWFHNLTPEYVGADKMDAIRGVMNWRVIWERYLRGSRRFWKKYEYWVTLEAIK